jgi:hypothetical protein
LTGEPILVIAPNPAAVSELVLGLVSLISPLPFAGDYRTSLSPLSFAKSSARPFTLLNRPCFMTVDTHTRTHACAQTHTLTHPLSPLGPYFTLYDPDFKRLVTIHDTNLADIPSVILGVNNPFFLKAMHSFPHVLVFGVVMLHARPLLWFDAACTSR